MPRFWTREEIDYLRKNHRNLHPSEMAVVLNTSETRTTRKLSQLNLQTKRAIDQQMVDAQILQMLGDGVSVISICSMLKVGTTHVKKVEKYLNVLRNPKVLAVEIEPEIDELIRNYKPYHEETGEYRYSELSRDEQIIYHLI